MAEHTCHCGQHYAVVNNRVAKPGYTHVSESVTPDEDIFGNVTGYSMKKSGRWIRQGPEVPITRRPDDGGLTWTYEWPCGDHMASIEEPAYDLVDCRYCAARSGTRNYYYGEASRCSCCYGNLRHWVPRGATT